MCAQAGWTSMCRTLIHCHSFYGVHRRTNTREQSPIGESAVACAPKPQRARSLVVVVDAVVVISISPESVRTNTYAVAERESVRKRERDRAGAVRTTGWRL